MGRFGSDRLGSLVQKLPFFPFIVAVALCVAPPDLLKGDPSKLAMPFLSLFMAGVFPTISLTIGSMKAGGFSVQKVTQLANELRKLVQYLQALFATALIAALCIISAETLEWGKGFFLSFYTARIFNFVIGFSLGSLVSALPKLRVAFSVLLQINQDIATDEAATKIKDRAAKMPSIVDRFPTKEKFGELFQADVIKSGNDE